MQLRTNTKYKTDSLLGSLAWCPKTGVHLGKNWLGNFLKLSVISFPNNVLGNLDHEKFPSQQFSVPYPHAYVSVFLGRVPHEKFYCLKNV